MANEKINPGIVSIDSLPKNLEVVDRPPQASGAPSVPLVEDSFQGAILSAGIGLQTDTAATQLPGALPTFRLQTVPPSGQPTVGAAIQSGILAGSSKSGGGGSIGLNIPSIFTPTTQVVPLPGPLSFALANELANTVFAGPISSFGPIAGYVDQIATNEAAGSGVVKLSITPKNAPSTVFFAATTPTPQSGTPTTPVGYTGLEVDSHDFIFIKTLSGIGTESPSSSWNNGASKWAGALFNVNGVLTLVTNLSVPQIISDGGAFTAFPALTTLNFPSTCVAGNAILIFVFIPSAYSNPIGITGFSLADNQGNTYYPVASLTDVTEQPTCMYVLFAPNIAAGTSSVTFSFTQATGAQIFGFEYSGATQISAPGIPTFRALVDADLPVVDAPHGGTGVATLAAHGVLIGEGTSPVAVVSPGTTGWVLTSNGASADPTFQAAVAAYYQTVQQAGVSKTQRAKLNFLAPITATDDLGNGSTDIAVPVFVGSGASHAIGLVPDPGASAGTTNFLCEDATWKPAGGGAGTGVEINGTAASSDFVITINSYIKVNSGQLWP